MCLFEFVELLLVITCQVFGQFGFDRCPLVGVGGGGANVWDCSTLCFQNPVSRAVKIRIICLRGFNSLEGHMQAGMHMPIMSMRVHCYHMVAAQV